MFGVCVVYAGLIAVFLGGISMLKPLAFLGVHTRLAGLCILGIGVLAVFLGWLVPVGEVRIASPQTRLDEFAPIYQFHEFHSIHINASRERVFQAVKDVTADEIFLFRTLTWIRRFGSSRRESILNAPRHVPILDVAARTGFILLAEDANREIVLGTGQATPGGIVPSHRPTADDFKNIRQPGFALASINFLTEDDSSGGTMLTSGTRVFATDGSTARKFARYWRIIYPGSALIRRMWLRAIKRRAETVTER